MMKMINLILALIPSVIVFIFIFLAVEIHDEPLMADDEIHVEEISDLATFLENKTEDTSSDIVDGDDWLMNSRN